MSLPEMDEAQRDLYYSIAGGPRSSQRAVVPITDSDGRLVGPFAVMLLTPAVGDAMQRVGAALRFQSGLTDTEREIATLCVAGELRSDFEWLAHEPAGRAAGLTPPQLDAIRSGRPAEGLSEEQAVVGRLARTMARDRSLPDEDYATGLAVLGRARLAELTWLVGYYSALALALAVFRPELPEGFPAAS